MVNPDADGPSWASKTAEENGRRGERLPASPITSLSLGTTPTAAMAYAVEMHCRSCRTCVAKNICNTFRQVSGERTHGIHLPSFRSEWTSLNKLVDD